METNTPDQQYFNGDPELDEPHFDEKATLLSARPVVPLAEIKYEERSRKRLVLGATIACSVAVGVLVATFIYKRSEQQPSITTVSKSAPGSTAITVNKSVVELAEIVEGGVAGTSAETEPATVPTKSLAPISRRPVSQPVEIKRKKSLPQQPEEIEPTPADRFEERRLRRSSAREAIRESRRRRRRSADDLLRIREIFEGPRRP